MYDEAIKIQRNWKKIAYKKHETLIEEVEK